MNYNRELIITGITSGEIKLSHQMWKDYHIRCGKTIMSDVERLSHQMW